LQRAGSEGVTIKVELRPVKAILLDRDGTINIERADYVRSLEQFELLKNSDIALGRLAQMQLPVGIVTNQSGIGRGVLDRTVVDAIHARLSAVARDQGLHIQVFALCPHHPDEGCYCRKPNPGLILQAASRIGVLPSECLVIGDSVSDYQAAMAAGSQAILVRTGRQGSHLETLCREAGIEPAGVLIVADLMEAVEHLSRRLALDMTTNKTSGSIVAHADAQVSM
jgi:D-glycero-D-manno-heptose 1,7-bisphosphate phosphatase